MIQLYDLAIVGAGLSALSALRAGVGGERTIVLDYQDTPGGFLKAALPAPGFEEAWELIRSLRISQETTTLYGATAVGLLPALEAGEPHVLIVRHRQGTEEVRAQRVLLACGGLEMTREHAQIPGTRPAGVITPILAHQLLSRGYLPGKRVVVYGNTRYAKATAQRLAAVGVEVTLVSPSLVEEAESSALQNSNETELVQIEGFPRLEKVIFRRHGQLFELEADTLVYGAAMMGNTHWLKGSGIITGVYGTIQVDTYYRTNMAGIYAVGTVVAPSLDHADSLAMGKEVATHLIGGT